MSPCVRLRGGRLPGNKTNKIRRNKKTEKIPDFCYLLLFFLCQLALNKIMGYTHGRRVSMTKKIIVALLMLCVAGSVFAVGIGIQGGTDVANSGTTGIDITFKLDSVPFVFAVGIPSFDPLAIGLTADYWILNDNLVGPLNWFIGAGLFGQMFIGDDDFNFTVGARVPVGLNFFFARDMFELYLQVAPGLGANIGNGVEMDFVCPINYGLRFWF